MSYVDMDCVALAHGGVASIATSYVTAASIAPSANRLCLLAIHSAPNGGASPPNQPTVTGAGMTWVAVRTQVAPGGVTGQARLTVFRAMKASPGSGQLTFDFGGQQQTGYQYAVLELAPVDASGTDGSGAIGDFSSGVFCPGSSSDPVKIELTFDVGSVSDVNQRVIAFFTNGNREHDARSGLHAVEVSDDHGAGPPPYVAMQSQIGLIDTVSATYYRETGHSSYFLILGVALVVKPASAYGSGPTDHPEFRLELSTTNPESDAQDWNDVSADAIHASVELASRSSEKEEFSAGTQEYTVENVSGDYRRSNTAGRFYPNLKKFRRMRSFIIWKGARMWLGDGRIETIDPTREGDYSEVVIRCNDSKEQLANVSLESGAQLATVQSKVRVSARSRRDSSWFDKGDQVAGLLKAGNPEGVAQSGNPGSATSVTMTLTANNPATYVDYNRDTNKIYVRLRSSGGVSLATSEEVTGAINSANLPVKAEQVGTGVVNSSSETQLTGGWPAELSGARLNRVLDNIEWPGGARVIDAGTQTIQKSQFVAGDNVVATQHMRDVELTENGQVFLDAQRRVVFQGSGARSAAPFDAPLFTVVDSHLDPDNPIEGEYEATQLEATEDAIHIHTRITASRTGGGTVTVTADQAHLDAYGKRDYELQTLHSTDAPLTTRATAFLNAHQDEHDRYEPIVLDPVTAGRAIYDVFVVAGISHRVRVKENSAPGVAPLSSDHFIEGVKYELDCKESMPFMWRTTYALSPVVS